MSLSTTHNLLHDRTDLLLPSLILHNPTSLSFPTCPSIMRAKGGKDLGMFSFLINTIFVITEFLWNMKYITVAIVATVNKNTVCIYAKNCFCFKVQSYSCKFSIPRKLSGFSVTRFLRVFKNLSLVLEAVRWDFRKQGFPKIEFVSWI